VEKPTSKVIRDGAAAQVVSWSPPLIGGTPEDILGAEDPDLVEVTDVAPGELRHAAVSALPTAAELERLHKKAHDDGFERRRAEGFRYGHQEALEAARGRSPSASRCSTSCWRPLPGRFGASTIRWSARSSGWSWPSCASSCAARSGPTRPDRRRVREALAILPVASRNVRVVLNPEDAALVRQVYALSDSELTWKIVEDPVVARGGCRV